LKITDVSEMRTASIIYLKKDAVRTSETSVIFNVTTWRYVSEESKLNIVQFSNSELRDPEAVRSEAKLLMAWKLRSWVQIPLR
jgi:hypothetical protein